MVVSAEHCKFGAFATTDGKFKNLLRIVKKWLCAIFYKERRGSGIVICDFCPLKKKLTSIKLWLCSLNKEKMNVSMTSDV